MSSKLVEAAASGLFNATPFKESVGDLNLQSDAYQRLTRVLAKAALTAALEAALEDEGVIEAGAEAIADVMNMNRPGRLENDAARSFLRALIQQVKS